jgi:hypothetical protein
MQWEERADENIGYEAFSAWPNVLDSLHLTNFDPAKRLSARQALEHPWFFQL